MRRKIAALLRRMADRLDTPGYNCVCTPSRFIENYGIFEVHRANCPEALNAEQAIRFSRTRAGGQP